MLKHFVLPRHLISIGIIILSNPKIIKIQYFSKHFICNFCNKNFVIDFKWLKFLSVNSQLVVPELMIKVRRRSSDSSWNLVYPQKEHGTSSVQCKRETHLQGGVGGMGYQGVQPIKKDRFRRNHISHATSRPRKFTSKLEVFFRILQDTLGYSWSTCADSPASYRSTKPSNNRACYPARAAVHVPTGNDLAGIRSNSLEVDVITPRDDSWIRIDLTRRVEQPLIQEGV